MQLHYVIQKCLGIKKKNNHDKSHTKGDTYEGILNPCKAHFFGCVFYIDNKEWRTNIFYIKFFNNIFAVSKG